MDSPSLPQALDEWAAIVGTSHVISHQDALAAAATATFATTSRVLAIVRPGTREQVQACMRVANRLSVPIYPFSSGKNWGYGSRAPVRDGVLLDLGRMNRILAFDEDLAYVTLEPGVTQRQLHEYLRDKQSRLWMDATGASPDCSIIGNTMERGFGHTPMGDHCGNACGFEVVLPTGDCLETGFSQFTGAVTGPLSRWGVGPSLDGLFSQSNLGIVTRMTVWLMPAPEHFEAFFFLCTAPDGLGAIIDSLRPLRLNGTLRSVMHIGNDYKVLAATGQYPWEAMQGRTPLDATTMETLRRQFGIGYWTGSGGLYGTRAQVGEAKRQLRRALAGRVKRLQFVNDRRLALMQRFATPFRMVTGWDISRTLKVLQPVYDLLKGVPTDSTMGSAYWRKKTAPPPQPDPDRDGCGLIWCSPVVPNTGAHATDVTKLVAEILLNHGFEPQISLSLATERTMTCVVTISFDRDVDGEDARALECYRALGQELMSRGYPPYRLSVAAMDLVEGQPGHRQAVAAIRQALDPRGVLSPGRYQR